MLWNGPLRKGSDGMRSTPFGKERAFYISATRHTVEFLPTYQTCCKYQKRSTIADDTPPPALLRKKKRDLISNFDAEQIIPASC